jgi:hypothetical protein
MAVKIQTLHPLMDKVDVEEVCTHLDFHEELLLKSDNLRAAGLVELLVIRAITQALSRVVGVVLVVVLRELQ